MKKQHSLESKHVQNSRDRYGKKIPQQYPYSPWKAPVFRCEGVSREDIAEYCEEKSSRNIWNGIFTAPYGFQHNNGMMTVTSVSVSSGTIYLSSNWGEPSEKDKTLKDLARIVEEKVQQNVPVEQYWETMEQGMVKEWERRQTKLYKVLK